MKTILTKFYQQKRPKQYARTFREVKLSWTGVPGQVLRPKLSLGPRPLARRLEWLNEFWSPDPDVFLRFIDQMLINLIRNTNNIWAFAKIGKFLNFFSCENFPKWIVWIVDYNRSEFFTFQKSKVGQNWRFLVKWRSSSLLNQFQISIFLSLTPTFHP